MPSSSAGDTPLGLLPTEIQPTGSHLTRDLFGQANVSLDALSVSLAAYDGLHGQTMQVAIGNSGEDQRITDVGLDIEKQQQRHKEGLAEIQSIINNILDEQAFIQLRDQIEKEISLQIDDIVQAQVAACLQTHIPKDLQDEVEDNKQELERARVALHNSSDLITHQRIASSLNPWAPYSALLWSSTTTSDSKERKFSMISHSVVNLYGGSPLNRLSWLRTSHSFLNAVIALPHTRWLLFNGGQPLLVSPQTQGDRSLEFLSTDDVKPFLGSETYFGQGQKPGDQISDGTEEGEHSHHSPTQSARIRGAPIIFVGVHETERDVAAALPTSEFKNPEVAIQKLKGTPYFALDVAELGLSGDEIRERLEGTLSKNGRTFSWAEPRSLMTTLDSFTAGVFAGARSMIDWNFRNKFCPGCGSPTYSMWGGWKIACTTLLPWADNTSKRPCPSGKGLNNYTHPRTDPVVIMIALDETGDKVLLGRGRKYPGKFYSALAGFIEPGESFEDAVAREMWEEAGVHVWDVRYHSGQPWPYPANLMVGFYARADSTKPIRIDLDNELVDARWFTREEVTAVLNHRTGTKFGKSDYKKMAEIVEGKPVEDQTNTNAAAQALTPPNSSAPRKAVVEPTSSPDDPPFRLPPVTAIAGMLIRDWIDGKVGFFDEPLKKGNL
ncbi:hypothetical protein EST38_g902 [Candolleomyces aberdarensis]|uniref:NAD(+) diphosphatase n=1 Tax=Candolleomyces aberdarensis TaxID=2316362 RepID=A0A4V1Q5A9_9AGAR|nr:hypothetical protein EST38_g902 [Candolleomyces aberdarensis]